MLSLGAYKRRYATCFRVLVSDIWVSVTDFSFGYLGIGYGFQGLGFGFGGARLRILEARFEGFIFGFARPRFQNLECLVTDFGVFDFVFLGFYAILCPQVLFLDCPEALAHNLITSLMSLAGP